MSRLLSSLAKYEKADDGTVYVRDKKRVSSNSVQNPNDPDAEYRSKAGKKVKGYSTNITETCDEKDKPSQRLMFNQFNATFTSGFLITCRTAGHF